MVSPFTQFGTVNGDLDSIDWDLALTKAIGAVLDEEQNEWYLPIPGVYVEVPGVGPTEITRALVVFKRPEPTQVEFNLPQIAITADEMQPIPDRLYSPTTQFRQPAPGSTPVSVGDCVGYTAYTVKEQERPYDFTYTLECWARYTPIARMLLHRMLKVFPMRGTISITDSAGCERTYLAIQESIVNLTEVLSPVDRVPGWGVTIRIEAEMTLDREAFTVPAYTGGGLTTTPPNGEEVNPDLPLGGLYGTGEPFIRSSVLED
jgi:hypothetical protein